MAAQSYELTEFHKIWQPNNSCFVVLCNTFSCLEDNWPQVHNEIKWNTTDIYLYLKILVLKAQAGIQNCIFNHTVQPFEQFFQTVLFFNRLNYKVFSVHKRNVLQYWQKCSPTLCVCALNEITCHRKIIQPFLPPGHPLQTSASLVSLCFNYALTHSLEMYLSVSDLSEKIRQTHNWYMCISTFPVYVLMQHSF